MSNKAIVVASAPSAKGFVPPDGVPVIAVNGAIDWIERADYFFTLDHSAANMNRLRNPRNGVTYFAAVPDDVVLPEHVYRLGRISMQGVEPKKPYTPEWWCWRWSAVKGLCETEGYIHSGNSAYGAVGLAYQLGFDDILLVGVDASKEEKIGGGHCKNLTHLPVLMRSALSQIKISTISKMDGIPHKRLNDWLKG